MHNYNIEEQEQDRIVNLVYKHLNKKTILSDYEVVAKNICNDYMTKNNALSSKQCNIIGSIFYRQVEIYKPLSKKEINKIVFNKKVRNYISEIFCRRSKIANDYKDDIAFYESIEYNRILEQFK